MSSSVRVRRSTRHAPPSPTLSHPSSSTPTPTSLFPLSTFATLQSIDKQLAAPHDTLTNRRQKITVFSISVCSGVLLTLYSVARLLTGGYDTYVGYIFIPLFLLATLITPTAIWKTKKVNTAFLIHFIGISFAILPIVVAVQAGVGLVAADGSIRLYQFIVAPLLPPLLAVTDATPLIILVYTTILGAGVAIATLINPLDNDLAGVPVHLAGTLFLLAVMAVVSVIAADLNQATVKIAEETMSKREDRVAGESRGSSRRHGDGGGGSGGGGGGGGGDGAGGSGGAHDCASPCRLDDLLSAEVRTPLLSLQQQVDLLTLTDLSSAQARTLRRLGATASSLIASATDIIDLAAASSPSLPTDVRVACLRDIVEGTVASTWAEWVAATILDGTPTIFVDPNISTYAVVDVGAVTLLVRHLFLHALRASQLVGDGNVVVRLDGSGSRGLWHLSVKGWGAELSSGRIAQTVDEARSLGRKVAATSTRGLTLSLCVARELAERLGGQLRLSSAEEAGTTNIATFSALPPSSAPPISTQRLPPTKSSHSWTIASYTANDDLATTIGVYSRYFLRGGTHKRIPYRDGSLALGQLVRRAKRRRPLLVVVNEPEVSDNLRAELRRMYSSPHLLFVSVAPADTVATFPTAVAAPLTLDSLCSVLHAALQQ